MPERFLEVSHIRQKSESDCLAACAAMLLAYVGFRIEYQRLLRLLEISEIGAPHSRIQRLLAIHKDVTLIYKQGTLDELLHFLEDGHPVIIFVDTAELPYWSLETGHAVVVVGYAEGIFYVNDPAFEAAPQSVSSEDLALAWDGYDHFLAVVKRQS